MQLLTDELIRACARLDPTLRLNMAEALEKVRVALMEEMVNVDAAQVGEHRGAVRLLKQLVHVVAHANQLIRQLDERAQKPPKLVL